MKRLRAFLITCLILSCQLNIANAQSVNIPDANLAAVVRKKLRITSSDHITRQAIQKLTDLNAQGSRVEKVTGSPGKISDLTGLEHATRLEFLSINNNSISDLTPLGKLTQLEFLSINNNNISNLTPLEKMKKLKELYISGNPLTNLTPLEKMTQLKALDISGYGIKDITMLKKMTKLERLYISHNAISNIMPLANLSLLKILDLRHNDIIDVKPLSKLNNLKRLKLAGNAIIDVSPLAKLNNLEQLDLRDNTIIDISPLTTLKNTAFSLDGNLITVNFPLTSNGIVLESQEFLVLSRNQNHSIVKNKVKIIYPDWNAFIEANPVILNSSKNRRDGGNTLRTLAKRIDDTLNSFRSDGQGGTIELIAHPSTKANFGDIIISEIMWGRHETPSDNQWIELYSPKKRVTLANNRFALLFTGTYLDREVIPSTQSYAGWKVIDRVRNAGSQENLAWQLPENSWGTDASEFPVSMYRAIDYDTGVVPDGSLVDSWGASSNQENLLSTDYGSPGSRGEPKVFIPALQRPPIYWIGEAFGSLQHLTDDRVENVGINTQNVTDLTIDTGGEKVYWAEKTGNTTGKIQRVNLDGSVVEEVRSFSGSVPLSIAVDSKGSRLYWINSRGQIQRSDLNGKSGKTLIKNLNSPKAIDLDVIGSKLYWTEPGSIWHADLNGKNAAEFIIGLKEIGSITIADSHIYWTEKIKQNLEVVKRVTLAGTNPEEVISVPNATFKDIAVDSIGKKLYWADSRGRIRRANLNGSRIENVVTGVAPHIHLALGVLTPENSTVQKNPLPTSLKNVKILVPASQRPPMYWVDSTQGTLHRLVGDRVENLAENSKGITSLAVDATNGFLYWGIQTGQNRGEIQRAELDSKDVQTLKKISSVPTSIAVDTTDEVVYWTTANGKIQRMSTGASSKVTNLALNLSRPTALTLSSGHLYWGEATGRVRQRSAVTGKKAIQNIVTGLDEPVSIAVHKGKVYWTERVESSHVSKLRSANLNGTNVQQLRSFSGATPIWFDIDGSANKIYWTLTTGKIQRANLLGKSIKNIVTQLSGLGPFALGIEKTDTPVTPEPLPPGTFSKYDVNDDDKVDKNDLVLVVLASGEKKKNNPHDVNGDGTVDGADQDTVREFIETYDVNGDGVVDEAEFTQKNRTDQAAAPPLDIDVTALDVDTLREQIERLLASGDQSLATQKMLAYLQQLLVLARPDETVLLANYPNPFNPETWIPYQLANSTDVQINIYNTQGLLVRTLRLGHQSAGYYTSRSRAAYWDGRNALGERVASGIYFYQLQTEETSIVQKMVISK